MAGKARVHELAKELGVTSKEVLARLTGWRIDIRSDAVPQTNPDATQGAVRDR